jgi:porin
MTAYRKTTAHLAAFAATCALATALPLANPAQAGEASQGGGASLGQTLADDGVGIRLGYTGEFASNPSGGIKQGSTLAGQVEGGVDLDLNRLIGLYGGLVHVTVTNRQGQSLAARDIGNSTSVQEIYGGGQTTRLTQFTYQQFLFDKRLDIEGGRTIANVDFLSLPIFCNFQSNSTCGNPTLVFKNTTNFTAWPVATWGGRVRGWFTPNVYAMVGGYEVNSSEGDGSHHGFKWDISGSQGAIVPFEVGYVTTFANDTLPRHYTVGGWYDDSDYSDPLNDSHGVPAALSGNAYATHNGRSGVYFLFQQMIWRPDLSSQRGVTLFGAALFGTSDHQVEDNFLELGLLKTGTFEGRDKDSIGFLVNNQHFSKDTMENIEIQRAAAGGTGKPSSNEVMMELNYTAEVTPWLKVTPNLQYIINPDQLNEPSRTTNISDTFVVGLKVSLDLATLSGLRVATP